MSLKSLLFSRFVVSLVFLGLFVACNDNPDAGDESNQSGTTTDNTDNDPLPVIEDSDDKDAGTSAPGNTDGGAQAMPDGGQTPPVMTDGGMVGEIDSGNHDTNNVDGGASGSDDAGVIAVDGGSSTSPDDAGSNNPVPDAGDTGPEYDAGSPEAPEDAGQEADGGVPENTDAGTPNHPGGHMDAGAVSPEDAGNHGCAFVDAGCHPLSACVEHDGGIGCAPCPNGYEGDGTICSDIDECNAMPCEEGLSCENTTGSFICNGCVDPDNDGYGIGADCQFEGEDCAPDSGTQYPGATEECNGADDNCNMEVDEGFDLLNDSANCGQCGNQCTATGGTAACLNGICGVSQCEPNLANCDSDPTDCETDITTSLQHCGGCNEECALPGAIAQCTADGCQFVSCLDGYADCDMDPSNGCEVDTSGGASCLCVPGETEACYDGDPATRNVGRCSDGERTCLASGLSFGFCLGQTFPINEVCGNDVDEDCSGALDDIPDADGDGFTPCENDCCDVPGDGCLEPAKVNPGAFDFDGNLLDDDCDGQIDNPKPTDCSDSILISNVTSDELAHAMDLCQFIEENDTRWGVLNTALYRADGTGSPVNLQVGVLDSFGFNVQPSQNLTLVDLSTGTARDQDNDADDTGYVYPDSCLSGSTVVNCFQDETNEVSAPSAYLDAHGGQLETSANCPAGETTVNDSVMLELTIKTPTNAEGFSFSSKFYSSEYPEYLCTQWNDFFLALLDSAHPDVLAVEDGNIAFDEGNNPVSVNNAFFTVCEPIQCRTTCTNTCSYPGDGLCDDGATGADYNVCDYGTDCADCGVRPACPGDMTCNATTGLCETSLGSCPAGTSELEGTGYPVDNAGATRWLKTTSPVIPGEIITLRFYIWDTGDHLWDSSVLLDNFTWLIDPTSIETKPPDGG